MKVMIQSVMPIPYEQYRELDHKVNPERLKPPGLILHLVSRNETGTAITDVWEDEASARQFYEAAAARVGQPMPPLTLTEVFEIL